MSSTVAFIKIVVVVIGRAMWSFRLNSRLQDYRVRRKESKTSAAQRVRTSTIQVQILSFV